MLLDRIVVHRVREGDRDAVALGALRAVRGVGRLDARHADRREAPADVAGGARGHAGRRDARAHGREERRRQRERPRRMEEERAVVEPFEAAVDARTRGLRDDAERRFRRRTVDRLVEADLDLGRGRDERRVVEREEDQHLRPQRREREGVVLIERRAELVREAREDARLVRRRRRPTPAGGRERVERRVQPAAFAQHRRVEVEDPLRAALVDHGQRRDGAAELHHHRRVEGDFLRSVLRERRRNLQLALGREAEAEVDRLGAVRHFAVRELQADVVRGAQREPRPVRLERQHVVLKIEAPRRRVLDLQRVHGDVAVDAPGEPDAHGRHRPHLVARWPEHLDAQRPVAAARAAATTREHEHKASAERAEDRHPADRGREACAPTEPRPALVKRVERRPHQFDDS